MSTPIDYNRANDWPDLDPKDRAFAMEYISNGFKHRDAAYTVGYSKAKGIQLLRDPLIAAYISHLQEQVRNTSLITAGFIETIYLQLLPKLMGDEEVPIVLSNGHQIEARKFHSSDTVSLLRDMTKFMANDLGDDDEADGSNVNISFEVRQPVADVKVTKGKKREPES